MPNHLTAVILAAGAGTRMKSIQPKVLCEVLFKPMLCWVEDACRTAGITDIVIVTGDDDSLLKVSPNCTFVRQYQRLGTGHALLMAKECLGDTVLVLNGDGPLITADTIKAALKQHLYEENALTIISSVVNNPTGYGRVLSNPLRIVEELDADESTRTIHEINSGIYWMDGEFLRKYLTIEAFKTHNAKNEYYITDLISIAQEAGKKTNAYICPDNVEILGANDRAGLANLNQIARERIIAHHLENGVDIPFTDGIVIGSDVTIGQGTHILPGTILLGNTNIGADCEIGPNSHVVDSKIGNGSKILSSWLTKCTVGENCSVGPFAQFRNDTNIGNNVKIGDFVELKNTNIGNRTAVAHLTYLGDCDIGENCNFGCGVVTANYDGKKKYRTTIGNRVFVGCNTNLISPVNIGDGAYTAAGTTIDKDVPAGALAIGRCRQEIHEKWADQNIGFKK